LLSIITAVHLVNLVGANFVPMYKGVKSPDDGTKPPIILMTSPENDAVYDTNNVQLIFNVSVGESANASSKWICELYYKGDWQENRTYIDLEEFYGESYASKRSSLLPPEFSFNLTNIPEGKHSITVYANETGYYDWFIYYWKFSIDASASINFTIDTVPPKVAVLSPQNITYETTDIPLNFTVNEPASEITYVLDGQANVTITGNMTLTELAEGSHNLTVYAEDAAGNVGTSETFYFSIYQAPKLRILGSTFPMEYGYAIVAATVIVAPIAGYLVLKILRQRPKQNATVNK
jgi:hypothetical protein